MATSSNDRKRKHRNLHTKDSADNNCRELNEYLKLQVFHLLKDAEESKKRIEELETDNKELKMQLDTTIKTISRMNEQMFNTEKNKSKDDYMVIFQKHKLEELDSIVK